VLIKNTSESGSTAPGTIVSTVEVGDAGNTALTIGSDNFGQVSENFRIGKYEVTLQQYTDFLNAVATRPDTYFFGASIIESLYDSRMATDQNVAGILRSGAGTEASPYAYSVIGDGRRPVTYVTYLNAARFANWMHNGAGTSSSTIEYGAYLLYGFNPAVPSKDESAKWWIPTEDEWFKAAYYKGGSLNAGYYTFPTKSDSLPGNSSSLTVNNANFLRLGTYAVTQSSTLSSTENYLTPVGDFINAPSAYGTFDQGGNVDEWTSTTLETAHGTAFITRGGGWSTGGLNNDASPASTALANDRSNKIGFRLAQLATQEGVPTLSGNFEVKIKDTSTPPKPLPRGEVAQFSIRKGSFTVVASDALNPSLTSEKTFPTGANRTTRITVSGTGSEITIAETTDTF
jgi:formylglycine-generating enzyme required for sulfatase activity